jgi:hypothetical protein
MSKKDFEVLFHAMLIATASITAVVGGALTLTGMICHVIKQYGKLEVLEVTINYFASWCPEL